jgi:hypothetical protein
MTKEIQTERRWLRSVIAASAEPLPNFPWMRATRRRPATLAEAAPFVRPAAPTVPVFARSRPIAAH